jgi:hypothetical protein
MLGRTIAILALLGALLPGCRRKEPSAAQRAAEARRIREELARRLSEKASPSATPAAEAVASAQRRGTEEHGPRTSASAGPAEPAAPPGPTAENAPFIADEPVQIGPAGPVTATARGVVMNTLDGALVVAPLGALAHGSASRASPVQALPESSGPFALVRGPSFSGDYAYWISHGSLARRKLLAGGSAGPLEVLAKDALEGTRVAVPLPAPGQPLAKIPPTVAYVVRPAQEGAPFLAKLWVEGAEPLLLTAEGNGAHSVSLVHTSDGVLALSVQARMAMTPVHARRIRFPGGRPELGDELVVWVGGGIQPLTEMAILPHGRDGLFGFIPQERSISEFGVARLDIGINPTMDTKTTWMLYPNGIDPAPVSAGHVCGEPVLMYAAPQTAEPDSKQELVIRVLDGEKPRFQRIATARSFYFTSIAELGGGALAAWVTDEGSGAATLRCKSSPK